MKKKIQLAKPKLKMIINGQYILQNKIGSGSFGEVYYAFDKINNCTYAAKLESCKIKSPKLIEEAKILNNLQDGDGFPKLIWFGTEYDYNIMIYELLGSTLENVFRTLNKKFSLNTIVNIVDQIISRIEYLHDIGYVHRDIKPNNFLIGKGETANKIYMIDFGLSKPYANTGSQNYLHFHQTGSLTGTARYASISAHVGMEQSRKDDLESVFYMVIYFIYGKLPWQIIKTVTKQEKYERILEDKILLMNELICKELPLELKKFLRYCKNLNSNDRPDYQYLKNIFKSMIPKYQLNNAVNSFDWIVTKAVNGKKNEKELNTLKSNMTIMKDSLAGLNIQENIDVQCIPHKDITLKNFQIMHGIHFRNKLGEDLCDLTADDNNKLIIKKASLKMSNYSSNTNSIKTNTNFLSVITNDKDMERSFISIIDDNTKLNNESPTTIRKLDIPRKLKPIISSNTNCNKEEIYDTIIESNNKCINTNENNYQENEITKIQKLNSSNSIMEMDYSLKSNYVFNYCYAKVPNNNNNNIEYIGQEKSKNNCTIF